MKVFITLGFLISLTCCEFPASSQTDRDKLVKLSQEDMGLYISLKNQILIDLVWIRAEMKKLSFASDTTYLFTNSYYLYQIDKDRYEPIILKLKRKNIYVDQINTSYDGTLEFRLKEFTDQRDLPHFSYTHSLVFNAKPEYMPPYSGTVEVLKDSAIGKDWRYIYYKAQVGH